MRPSQQCLRDDAHADKRVSCSLPCVQMGERVRWAPAPQALLQAFPQRFLVNFG